MGPSNFPTVAGSFINVASSLEAVTHLQRVQRKRKRERERGGAVPAASLFRSPSPSFSCTFLHHCPCRWYMQKKADHHLVCFSRRR
ncbi:unnamed protein product [Victoria cruziana]